MRSRRGEPVDVGPRTLEACRGARACGGDPRDDAVAGAGYDVGARREGPQELTAPRETSVTSIGPPSGRCSSRSRRPWRRAAPSRAGSWASRPRGRRGRPPRASRAGTSRCRRSPSKRMVSTMPGTAVSAPGESRRPSRCAGAPGGAGSGPPLALLLAGGVVAAVLLEVALLPRALIFCAITGRWRPARRARPSAGRGRPGSARSPASASRSR